MAAGTQVAPLLLMIKLTRMVPWVGAAFALAVLASTMRRKGVMRGALDAALDVTPVLGGVKMIAEKIRGRDFIPDRPSVSS